MYFNLLKCFLGFYVCYVNIGLVSLSLSLSLQRAHCVVRTRWLKNMGLCQIFDELSMGTKIIGILMSA